MTSQAQQHLDTLTRRPFRLSIRYAMQLLVAFSALSSLPTIALCQEQPRLQPDGAPGENLAPNGGEERFAQVEEPKEAEADEAKPAADEVFEEGDADPQAEDEDDPRSQRNLDNIDFRAPINRAKQTAWQKIERAAQGRDWNDVLSRLDRFIGPVDRPESEDYVIRHADGSLKSVRLSTAKLLGSVPENLRVARARTDGTLAKTMLDQAILNNSLRELNHVAVRFFGTPIGYRAADRLAAQLVDRGEFALAANWLKLLWDSDALLKQSPAWQKKARMILDLTNQPRDPKALSETLQILRKQFVGAEPAELAHWPMLGGNSKRHAEPSAASRPVMIRRWQFPTTSNSGLKSTVEQLISDLTYRSVATIPAAAPIFVDGKLVCRTFRGIEVLDAESGQHLWTTAESASVEGLLGSASPNARSVADLMPNMTPLYSAAAAVDRTGGPIGQFVFQNAAHGIISSDRKTVYFLEDDPVFTLGRTSIRRAAGGNASPRPESTTSNRLKAYDLETGEPAWQIGGPDTSEPFAPKLAGWFFLGAPLPDRGDLFIVGQKENAIRLFCLDPDSGSARWSQQLAFAEEGLERNLNRRLWSAQLATAHGIVVCPTTVGWLVGVDRSTGTIVWTHRYSERKPAGRIGSPRLFRGNQRGIQLANESIGETWIPSAPIIMGDRVVYAPSEPRDESDATTRFLDCVNVFTGERIWSLPREQALAVAGASHGRAVVTWPSSIAILNSDGTTQAEIEFDADDGLPCGRGVVANDSFWLPLQKNVLLRFDLEQATLAERIEVASGYPALGNLAFYQGLLISHAAAGITAWELEENLGARLATIRSSGDTGKADIVEAQLALSRKQYSAAIELLLPQLATNSDTMLHQSILTLLMQAATGQVKTKPDQALALLDQVEPLFEATGVEGAAFELQRRQLEIESLLELNRPADAFEQLLDLTTESSVGVIKRFGDDQIEVDIDAWLPRRFQSVWIRLSAAEQTRMTGRINQLFKQLDQPETSAADQARLATLFSFHPGSLKLARQLADEAIAAQLFADAEHWLDQITASAAPPQSAEAMLNRLRLRSELAIADPDTRDLASQLQSSFASTTLPDGTGVSAALKPLLAKLGKSSQTMSSDWGKISLTATRSAATAQPNRSPRLVADRPSNKYRIETHNSGSDSNRLSFFDRQSGDLFWTVSLRSNTGSETGSNQSLTVYQTGQLYAVLSRGVLNMLSLPERRVLWTQPVEGLDNARRSAVRRGRPLEDVEEWMLRRRPGSMDAVPVVNSSYVCSRASRSLAVFDSRTGQLRWRLEPLERSLRVLGTRNHVFLTRPNGTISAAHNATDGQPIDPDLFQAELPESAALVKVDEHSIVTISQSTPEVEKSGNNNSLEPDPVVTLGAIDPVTRKKLWSHEFSSKIKVRMISNDQLAILARFGRIKVLNFRTGALTEFEKIPTRLRLGSPEFSIFSDGQILYVVLTRDTLPDASKPSLPSMLLNGTVIAFDEETGKELWAQEMSGQYLILERLDQLPFLITTSYRRNFILKPPDIRRITVLDKRDGSLLLDTKDEPGEAGFHSMIIDTDGRHVDLISNAERLRLKATPIAN
ncbi:MAG: outer membrane protein assembly factor BamB family protein [Planctomycetales bacterium]